MDHEKVLESARKVLRIEGDAIEALRSRLGEEFAVAVDLLKTCSGRIVFAGMGKSGLVCRKIAATFASTGTPSLFLHPAEGGHGDLGMLARGDVLVAVSNSGETQELIRLLPAVKRLGIPIISMTGGPSSTLAARADIILDISVAEEACPLNLAPTASTTVTMALGDALAVALLEARGFTEDDFALFHPVGALEKGSDPLSLTAGEVMTHSPKVLNAEALAAKALQLMESNKITSLVIVGHDNRVAGVIHMHDILKAGIA